MALDDTAARKWVHDIRLGIIDDEWFGPVAHYVANPSPSPPPSTSSMKEPKFWVAAQ